MTDYYDTLGVSSRSDIEVIRAAYKALMRKHHPDHNRSDSNGVRAKEINEAFAVLRDPAKRRRYDEMLQRERVQQSSPRPRPAPDPRPAPRRAAATSRWTLASVALIVVCGLLYLVAIGQQALAVSVLAPPATRAAPALKGALDQPSRSAAEAAPMVHAASFDCDLATLRVERQVCADARLAARDVELAALYDDLDDRFRWQERSALRDSQKDWVTERNLCWTEHCVREAYDERIALLRTIKVPRGGAPYSPSFDCDLARSWAEEKVCRDAILAAKDVEMIRLHDRLRDSLPGSQFLALRDSQAAWMASRDSCRTHSCISDAYDRRTQVLREKLQLRGK